MKARKAASSVGFVAIICILTLVASCSGRGGSSGAGKAPPKTNQAKAAPAAPAPKADQASSASDWVACGFDREGSKIFYDRKNVQRPKERKAVGFWLLATPSKDSKIFTEARERLKNEGKDYQSLTSMKMLCEANCETITYDMSKVQMVKADGTPLSEQDAGVRNRKPGPEIKTLIEKLCSGDAPGPVAKASTQPAQATCERAGIMVLIQPQEAIVAGAKWRIEGGEWKDSGQKLCNLQVDPKTGKGLYKVEYKELPDTAYVTPETHDATVSNESTYSFYNTEYRAKATGQKK